MSGFKLSAEGDLSKTYEFLKRAKGNKWLSALRECGELGVQALKEATPKDTGKTANSWSYDIVEEKDRITVWFRNSNANKYCNIAFLIQYGHVTGTGGYVQGVDYINPALKPIFDKIATDTWKEVTIG